MPVLLLLVAGYDYVLKYLVPWYCALGYARRQARGTGMLLPLWPLTN